MYAFPLAHDNLQSYSFTSEEQETLSEPSPEVRRGLNKLPDYEKIEAVLSGLLPTKGNLVEVGAYSGMLLKSFRAQGWRATGIEPYGPATEFARRAYDLDVRHGTLLTSGLEKESADAVVMLHVIEHMDDPATKFRAVNRLLRDSGTFVVETPIYDTLAYRVLGQRERRLSCDGYIFFYTQDTQTRLLQDSGFTTLRAERVGRTMSLARLLRSFSVMSKSASIQRNLQAASKRFGLDKRHIYLNARDMIRVYARKDAEAH